MLVTAGVHQNRCARRRLAETLVVAGFSRST